MAAVARRGGRAPRRPGHRRDRRRSALGQAARPAPSSAWPATTGSSSASRTTAGSAAPAPRCSSCSTTRASPRRSRCTASRRSSSHHAERAGDPRPDRPERPDHRPRHRRAARRRRDTWSLADQPEDGASARATDGDYGLGTRSPVRCRARSMTGSSDTGTSHLRTAGDSTGRRRVPGRRRGGWRVVEPRSRS